MEDWNHFLLPYQQALMSLKLNAGNAQTIS